MVESSDMVDIRIVLPIAGLILTILAVLHQLLIKKKEATIESQDKEIARLSRYLAEAKESSPDILAERYRKKLDRQEAELRELMNEREADSIVIKEKEAEVQCTKQEITVLKGQIESANEVLETFKSFKDEFSCPFCGAPVAAIGSFNESGYTEYRCGFAYSEDSSHPCPHDPEFPTLNDYELELRHNEEKNQWWCKAVPKNERAWKLSLGTTQGESAQKAKDRMIEYYNYQSRYVPKKP